MSLDALARSANFRDLGGHASADGRRIRGGIMFRSGELSRLARRERAALESLGIRTIIDLRRDEEVARRGVTPPPPGGRVVRLPIDSGDLTSHLVSTIVRGDFGAVAPDLLEQVNRQVVRDVNRALREAAAIIADASAGPIVFHCTHGKDRTGVLAAIVLMALDVPWETIVADYLRSNDHPTAQHRRQLVAVRWFARCLSMRPWRAPDLGGVERLFRVVPENLEAARAEMEARHGDVDTFLSEALGLGMETRAALRGRLLVPHAAGFRSPEDPIGGYADRAHSSEIVSRDAEEQANDPRPLPHAHRRE